MGERGFQKLKITVSGICVLSFLLTCVLVPITTLILKCESIAGLFSQPLLGVVQFTIKQAALSTLISAAIGLPLGLWIGKGSLGERAWCEFLLAIPFSIPTMVAAMAWVILLGRNGWLAQIGMKLDWSYSFKAVVLAHVVFNVPWITLWVAQSRAFMPESLHETARSLGAGRLARFKLVHWPQVRWSFLSATTQTFIFCVMSFALILILGGGPPVSTLETEIYSKIRFGSLDISGAVVCAIWEMILTLAPWGILIFFQNRVHRNQPVRNSRVLRAKAYENAPSRNSLFSPRVVLSVVWVLPYLAVLFANLKAVFAALNSEVLGTLAQSFWISLVIAFWTSLISILTAIASVVFLSSFPREKRGALEILLGVPSGVSVLALGLGFWLAYDRWVDPFSGSMAAIVLLQGTLFFPIAFRVFWPLAQDRPLGLIEAARSLGGGPLRVFLTLEWPRWRLPLLSTLGMVSAASLGEVAAISLFYSEKLIPVPLLVARFLNQYHFEQAQAVSAILMVACMAVVALSFGVRKWGESFGKS